MATCSAGNCSITCSNGCGCIGSGNDCSCKCGDDRITRLATPLELDSVVAIDVKDLSLVSLAAFLNANFSGELLLPAETAFRQVSLQRDNIPFSEVLEQLGLSYK